MPNHANLLDLGAGAAGLKDDLDLIRGLIETADKWRDLARELGSGATGPDELFETIVDDLGSEEVKTAFSKVGLAGTHGRLTALVAKAKAIDDKIPAKYKLLLKPLTSFAAGPADSGKVGWNIVDANRKFSGPKSLSVELGAKVGIEFEAGDKPKINEVESAKPLLRVSAALGVTGKAGAKLPFKIGSAAVDGSGKADAELSFYFDAGDSAALYGLALAERLPKLPNPFDYGAVWNGFASTDLDALVFRVGGEIGLRVDVALATSVGLGPKAVAELGAKISAAAKLSDTFALTLRPRRGGTGTLEALDVALRREFSSTRSISVGLSAEVDLSKLAQEVHGVLKEAFDEGQTILKEITPFLSPGTLIRKEASDLLKEEVGRLIDDEDVRAAFLADTDLILGLGEGTGSALADWLEERIAGALDRAEGVLTDTGNAGRDRALAIIGDRIPAPLRDKALAELTKTLNKLIQDARGKLRKRVEDAIAIDERRKALEDALQKANSAVSRPLDSVDKALKPVRDLIDRYEKFFKEVLERTSDASKMKVALNVRLGGERIDEAKDLIVGRLTGPGEPSEEVFDDLVRGDLGRLMAAFERGGVPGFEIDPSSALERYAKRTRTTSFDFVVFGIGVSGDQIVSGDARVRVDGGGNVRVESSAEFNTNTNKPRESQQISFLESFVLVRKAGTGELIRVMDLGLNVTHTDKSLKVREIEGMVKSLGRAGLVPAGTDARAGATLAEWRAAEPGKDGVKADAAIKFRLTPAQIETLLRLNQRSGPDRGLTEAIRQEVYEKAWAGLLAAGEDLDKIEDELKDTFRPMLPKPLRDGPPPHLLRHIPAKWHQLHVLLEQRDRTRPQPTPTEEGDLRNPQRAKAVTRLRERIEHLFTLVDLMGKLYLAAPATPGGANPPGSWDRKTYAETQRKIASQTRQWLTVKTEFVFWIDDEVHPRTTALMHALGSLAGGPTATQPPPGTVAIALTRQTGGEPVTVALPA